MADNNEEGRINVDSFDFANEGASEETPMLVNYLITRLQQAMANSALQGEVQQQLQAYGFLPPHQEERIPEKSLGETSKRAISKVREGENPYEELQNLLLDDTHQSRRRGHAQRQEPPSKEKERSQSPDESIEEDVAPRRRRAQRSPTPTKRKRSPHRPPRRESKKEEKDSKKKKERKRSHSSPSSSPSSSSDESGGYSSRESPRRGHRRSHAAWRRSNKLKKFKDGGKSISFLTYDGTFGATDKVLAFIQQFNAAFGDEGFTESSKLRHLAIHFQKSARQWWASLWANGEAPQTWKNLKASIMKQFLSSDAKDKVLTEWQSLKLTPYESILKYIDKFWDLYLKATVYKKIDFEEQKQQFCAGLPEDMNKYVTSQRPKTISVVIHHTMVAARINFQQGAKRNLKPMETKEKHEHKGKNQRQNSSKGKSSNNKVKEKGDYKGKNRLTPKELECYRKDNRCFKCGEQGHAYRACPQRNARNEQPRASIIEAPKEDVHCKGSPLSYAWGKCARVPISTSTQSSNAVSNTRKWKSSDIWSANEVNILLDLYEDKWISLNRGNFKAKHWTELAWDIQTHCAVAFTDAQCQNKWDNMKNTFIKEKQKEACSGVEPSHWEFYSRMEDLIGGTPKVSGLGDGFTGEDFVNLEVVSLAEDEDMAATEGEGGLPEAGERDVGVS
ncbi:hypothetical protein L7F22_053473 [Adiantum nelumboides]|nr:hypothetical protein [Adiantum nelumboides]